MNLGNIREQADPSARRRCSEQSDASGNTRCDASRHPCDAARAGEVARPDIGSDNRKHHSAETEC
jgi:hypothetical protein